MTEVLDPTLQAKSRFDDESAWQVVRGRPVFTEHDEFEKDRESPNYGKLKKRFDEAALEEIAAKCNARFERTGDACPLVLGHTMPGKPEKEQPEICGYALNFRVGHFGPEQKLGILSDWYLFPELELHNGSGTGVLDQYPRCSVELYPNDNVFDPISLLRRTPELDMGLTVYSPQETAAIYQRLGREHRRRYICTLSGPVVRYAMGDEAMANDMAQPDQAEMFRRHFACSDKVMQHFRAKYEAQDGSEKTEAPELADDLKEKFAKYGRFVAKHSRAYKKAAKRYQEETGETLDDSEQYAADDMSDEEKKEAAKFSKHFAKSKLMKYALDDEEDIPVEPAPATPPAAPPPPPVAGEDDSIDYGADEQGDLPEIHARTADRYWKHMVRQGHVKKYLDQMVKKHYAAGFPGGSNTFTPPGPEGAGTPVPGGSPEQFSKKETTVSTTAVNDPAAIQYAKENAALKQQLQQAMSRVDALERDNKVRAEREALAIGNVCCTQLEGEGYSFAGNRDAYVQRFAKADDVQRKTLMTEIRENWKQVGPPVGGPQIHVAADADPAAVQYARETFAKQGGVARFGKEEKDQALQYMKDNNLPAEKWPEVVKKFERKIA